MNEFALLPVLFKYLPFPLLEKHNQEKKKAAVFNQKYTLYIPRVDSKSFREYFNFITFHLKRFNSGYLCNFSTHTHKCRIFFLNTFS